MWCPTAVCVHVFADVVYVGVIHPFHLSTCLLFMNAKKNVLCEKPLAMNAREVKEILTSAKVNDVFLMEVQMEQTVVFLTPYRIIHHWDFTRYKFSWKQALTIWLR